MMMMSQTATLSNIYSTAADNLMMNVSPSTTATTQSQQQQQLNTQQPLSPNNQLNSGGMSSNNTNSTSPYHHQIQQHGMSANNNNNSMVDPNNVVPGSSQQQQQLTAHNNNTVSVANNHMNGSSVVGGMGTNTGNTQVLQELFRQQHLQTQTMTYPQLNNSALHQHSNFSNNGLDPNSNNLNSQTSNDYSNLILNMAIRGNEPNSTADHQDFVMQQMLLQQQSQHMMQPHHHYTNMPNAAMGLSQPVHHPTANHLAQSNQMMHHPSLQHHSMNSATLQQQVGLSNYQDNILNFLGGNQQEADTTLDQSNHDNLMMNNSAAQHLQIAQNNNDWGRNDKVDFTYFNSVAPYVEHTQSASVVDNSQLHTNGTHNLDEVVMRNNQSVLHQQHDQNQATNGLMMHTYEQMNGNLYPRTMPQQSQMTTPQQTMIGTPTMNKKTKLVNESPKIISNEDPNREVTNCHCCGRSDAEVSFKKNYSIHEGNIESYRNTFPQNIDQITSGPVCATCYNKQWRFQRGLYDPQKIRKNNPREGIKQRSMRDGDSTGSPLTPTLAFPMNNRVSAIQTNSPTNCSPRTQKRKLTVSTFTANPLHNINNGNSDHGLSDNSNDKHDPESKRTKFTSEMETLCKRNKNPDEISIIVQFYQVDNDTASDSSILLDLINEFNQTQLRIQKQQMFGINPNEKDSEISKHFQQFYTTALKVNKKHFEVSQSNTLQLIQGKIALENIKQLLTDRAKDFKQSKLDDPKTSTSTSDASVLSNSSALVDTKVLSLKISSQDRFKNTILADVDEFFFVDKNLREGDSIHVFLQ